MEELIRKNMLGYYLAGLIEGDGSIIVPKTHRNEKGKLLYPIIKITFVEKDAPLAIKLKEVFGAGTLEYPRNTKYVNLLFQDVTSLQKGQYLSLYHFYIRFILQPSCPRVTKLE